MFSAISIPVTLREFLLSTKRIIKVESFYLVLLVKAHRFNPRIRRTWSR